MTAKTLEMYYNHVLHLGVSVDCSKRGDYIAKHGVTPEQADEALNDANAVLQIRLNPEELESLERIARSRELPVSTIAREQLLRLIAEDHFESPRALAQLRERLAGAADTILQVADTIAGTSSG